MRVGAELKAARKKAGITVEVISKRTKISVGKLVALEKNDFKNLPTGLYLFALVRAYAREVRIDPEPIVETLRAEFADKDTLDALHALNATGALDSKNPANVSRSKQEQSNLLRNAAIAAAVVLMAAAGAGAYYHTAGRPAHEVAVSLSLPAPAATIPPVMDTPQQAAKAPSRPAPAKTPRSKRRASTVTPEPQEAVASADTTSEEPSGKTADIEEVRPENPRAATAP